MAGGVITTGSLPKLLWPGVRATFGIAYNEHEKVFPQLFNKVNSDKAYEEYVGVTGFSLAAVKAQGTSLAYDSQSQGFTTRLTNATVALGYIVTYEEIKDNLYPKVSKTRTKALAFSMVQAKELFAHLVYNQAFSSTLQTGADGVALASTAHPLVGGGTYANTPVTSSDLSETSLEDALIAIDGFVDDKGLLINVKGRSLIVPRQEFYNATRIMKSMYQSGTANNDINAIQYTGALPDGIIKSVYLTAPHAWFIRTDNGGEDAGMLWQERESIRFFNDNDFDTFNEKAGSMERYAFGFDDARALWAVNGP
jgi:hypothetical protein